MADEWSGVIKSTAPKYLKGAADLTMRQRYLLTSLQNRGRIKFNESGVDCNWDVEFFQPPVEDYADGGIINYARHDTLRQLSVDWRGYKTSDQMTRKEKEMNKGDTAIVNRYGRIMPQLLKSMRDNFCGELFIDGYATGNENRLIGLESFMGTGTTVAADRLAESSDTYGGLSTALGNQGGSWSADLSTSPNANVGTDWPDGAGDSHYDYLTPKLVNWSSNGWGTGVQTWSGNAIRALRQTKIWLTLTGGREGTPDCALMSGNMFYDFKNAHESKLRVVVEHKEANDLGFPDTLNFDGMAVKEDYDVPVNTCYVINVDQMELAALTSELFHSVGPDYDNRVDAWLFHVGFFGNARYQPKYFGKIKNFAS